MSSMTDIVFLLLIFFLVTSTLINPNAKNGISNPERSGYRFDGWATAPNGAVVYTSENVATAPSGTVLYAIWTPATAE